MSNIPTDAEYIESKKKPITDEKLAELDDWYSKCKSNSLMFCDADYLAIRERLRLSEKERDSLRAERDAALAELAAADAERDAAASERAALWRVVVAVQASLDGSHEWIFRAIAELPKRE